MLYCGEQAYCGGFSHCGAQALGHAGTRSRGPRAQLLRLMGFNRPVAYGIFSNQGLNRCPLQWQIFTHRTSRKVTPVGSCAVLSRSVVSNSLHPHGLQPARHLCPWGFSRQEYWSGLPCPPAGDLPNPAIEPRLPSLQADS